MKRKLKVPKFSNEDKERDFWAHLDLSRYEKAEDFGSVLFPNLKPSSRSISIRIPEMLLAQLKERANELHVPYQSLIKQYLARAVVKR